MLSPAFCFVIWEMEEVCKFVMSGCLGVLKATYNGQTVAVKALKDGSKDAQEFLAEASVMT